MAWPEEDKCIFTIINVGIFEGIENHIPTIATFVNKEVAGYCYRICVRIDIGFYENCFALLLNEVSMGRIRSIRWGANFAHTVIEVRVALGELSWRCCSISPERPKDFSQAGADDIHQMLLPIIICLLNVIRTWPQFVLIQRSYINYNTLNGREISVPHLHGYCS